MALSPSKFKLLADVLSLPIFRRGYTATAAAAQEAVSGFSGGSRGEMMGKWEQRAVMKEDQGASSAWSPDPITGYYRPANSMAEIDPADLREMLLNHRVRPN